MPSSVPYKPNSLLLRNLVTANPTQASHVGSWIDNLNFLNGYNFQVIANQSYISNNPSSNPTLSASTGFFYQPSYGVETLLLSFELQQTTNTDGATRDCYVNLASGSGVPFLGSNSIFDQSVTGSARLINYPLGSYSSGPEERQYFDVRYQSRTSPVFVPIKALNGAGAYTSTAGQGLWRLSVAEIPRATLNPSSGSSAGIEELWPYGFGQIAEYSGTSFGMLRLWSELKKAKEQNRKHWQISACEEFNFCFVLTGSAFTDTDLNYGSSVDEVSYSGTAARRYWKHKVRFFGTGSVNYTICVRYKTNQSLRESHLNINYRGLGGGSFSSQTADLGPSTTYTTATSATVSFPNTGTDNIVEFYISGQNEQGSDRLDITNIALIEQ